MLVPKCEEKSVRREFVSKDRQKPIGCTGKRGRSRAQNIGGVDSDDADGSDDCVLVNLSVRRRMGKNWLHSAMTN